MPNLPLNARAPSANPAFTAALRALDRADRALDLVGGVHAMNRHAAALARVMAIPAPDVAGLAAKLAAADPISFEHHEAVLADARRLAGVTQ